MGNERNRLIALFLLFVFVAAAIAIVAMLLPRLRDAIDFGSADEINKLLLAMAGLAGVPFLIWRTWIADQQKHIAREELYTSLLTKAVEQLGTTREEPEIQFVPDGERMKLERVQKAAPNIEVRLGAIYSLEKIAIDYLPLHWQIMEILCAYVRKNAGLPRTCSNETRAIYTKPFRPSWGENEWKEAEAHQQSLTPPRVDVQAALTVIGRRSKRQRSLELRKRQVGNRTALDLSDCQLAKAKLNGLHFENANFDRSSLEEALLDYGNFEGASFCSTHLERASLSHATLAQAELISAHLTAATCIGTRFTSARFDHAELIGAHFHNAAFNGAMFNETDLLGAILDRANLKKSYSISRANRLGLWRRFYDSARWAHSSQILVRILRSRSTSSAQVGTV